MKVVRVLVGRVIVDHGVSVEGELGSDSMMVVLV